MRWLLTILFCSPLLAANHYVRAGATGTGSGNDWTNAYTDFTGSCAVGSLVRGDTYYVAGGTYAGRTFNRATSGTTRIILQGATIANHGTDTGWQDSYAVCNGTTQAYWNNDITFSTEYWDFNGACGPATPLSTGGGNPSNYGFSVESQASCAATPRVVISMEAINNRLYYVSIRNNCTPGTANCQFGVRFFNVTSSDSGMVFSHTYAENNHTDFQGTNLSGVNNVLWEYHYSKGASTNPSCHGEVWALSGTGSTIRWSYTEQCQGTACIASNGGNMDNTEVYGNVLNGIGQSSGGNAAIAGAGSTDLVGWKIYNNTLYHVLNGFSFGWIYTNANGSGNVAKNNIVEQICGIDNDAQVDNDYNYYLNCSGASPSEPNKQTSSSEPWVDRPNGNWHLAADTNAWTPLGAPYNVDMDGVTRTSSRGAFQFVVSGVARTITGKVTITGKSQ